MRREPELIFGDLSQTCTGQTFWPCTPYGADELASKISIERHDRNAFRHDLKATYLLLSKAGNFRVGQQRQRLIHWFPNLLGHCSGQELEADAVFRFQYAY